MDRSDRNPDRRRRRRRGDHYARHAARCGANALARAGAALVGAARRPDGGLCRSAWPRRCGSKDWCSPPAGALWYLAGSVVLAEEGRLAGARHGGGRVRRAEPAAPGQHRLVRPHRGFRARPCRPVACHHRDGECQRTLRLLDRAGDRQCACHRAGRRGGEHPDHAPAAVRILHPLPHRRRAGVQAAAATRSSPTTNLSKA